MQESQSLVEQLRGLEKELSLVSSTADEEEWERLVKQAEAVKVSCMLLLHILGLLGLNGFKRSIFMSFLGGVAIFLFLFLSLICLLCC